MIRIIEYGTLSNEEIFDRTIHPVEVEGAVKDILLDVRQRGDEALLEYTRRFDGAVLTELLVKKEEIDEAICGVDPGFLRILERAAERIRAYHEHQRQSSYWITQEEGVILGQKAVPLDRVGLYVPGGTAAYPSTVLMGAIPAKIAGCREIIMATPPAPDGRIAPVILAAARVAGVDRIYKMGGAQAVAAMTYGTQSIPGADKIVGPGNAYVAEAKKQVNGIVAIDMIAGPSEILIIADGESDPAHVAADMLSQAEHDRLASAILVTDSRDLAVAVAAQLEKQLSMLPREEIARYAIEKNSKIILTRDLKEAMDISNAIAPEHLELCVDQPFDYLNLVRHAGSVFLGRNCPEALGDYFAGPNHTLPTGGTARFSSPLSVHDFVKRIQFSYYSREALRDVAQDVARFAEEEGLSAHAKSVLIRMEEEQ
ncbi:MAG: histidinol dehydrogenase [Candidatus Excrementavichristensenella sp.]|jgi:histidinol dehydrogenase